MAIKGKAYTCLLYFTNTQHRLPTQRGQERVFISLCLSSFEGRGLTFGKSQSLDPLECYFGQNSSFEVMTLWKPGPLPVINWKAEARGTICRPARQLSVTATEGNHFLNTQLGNSRDIISNSHSLLTLLLDPRGNNYWKIRKHPSLNLVCFRPQVRRRHILCWVH
jgi:hypothetical protein